MTDQIVLEQTQQPKKRIAWIDFAKFIGVMLVIIGHRAGVKLLNMFIFSFHVPVFFALSGMTFSFSKDWKSFGKKTLKRFIRILIPYLVTLTIVFIVVLIRDNSQLTSAKWWTNQTYRYIGYVSANYLNVHALWFLFALFTGGTLFDLFHLLCKNDGLLGIICGLFSLVGVIAGKFEFLMPLSLDVSMAILIFLFLGYKLKNFDFSKRPLLRNIILLIVWGATMVIMWFSATGGTYMAISNRRYTLFPLCYICAVAGSLLFLQVIFWIEKYLPKVMTKPISFLGRYTLYIVCIHGFGQFCFKYWFNISENVHINNLVYFGVGTAMFIVVLAADLLIHKLMKQRKEKLNQQSKEIMEDK